MWCLPFAGMAVHNDMMMHLSIAFENLSRSIPLIDEDQKVAVLHAPFKGTTLFGGELAKSQKVNTESASASPTYAPKPYTDRGRSFRKGGYSQKRGGWDRDHYRSAPFSHNHQAAQGQLWSDHHDCYSPS